MLVNASALCCTDKLLHKLECTRYLVALTVVAQQAGSSAHSVGFATPTQGTCCCNSFVVLLTSQVPVFIFELDRDEPVLIDQHYNARALEDLVIVVQNAANQ